MSLRRFVQRRLALAARVKLIAPVSTAVNNVRNETAECVERVEISAPAPKHDPQLLLF